MCQQIAAEVDNDAQLSLLIYVSRKRSETRAHHANNSPQPFFGIAIFLPMYVSREGIMTSKQPPSVRPKMSLARYR